MSCKKVQFCDFFLDFYLLILWVAGINHFYNQTEIMYGKVIAIVVLLNSAYILYLEMVNPKSNDTISSQNPYFHLGCFDPNHDQSHSHQMIVFLNQARHQSEHSPNETLEQIQNRIKLGYESFNQNSQQAAMQFQNYLNTQYQIQSHGQEQQKYQKALKIAFEDFKNCHKSILNQPWDCQQVYHSYLALQKQFESTKTNSQAQLNAKAQYLKQIEKFNDPSEDSDENDNWTKQYHFKIESLNRQLNEVQNNLRQQNITLYEILQELNQKQLNLNDAKNFLKECNDNKQQIDYCEKISQNIEKIQYGTTKEEIHHKINKKRQVLEFQQAALAKTKKLNESTVQLETEIIRNKQELASLEEIFRLLDNTGLCADKIVLKCTAQDIDNLQQNITLFTNRIDELKTNKIYGQIALKQLQEEIKKLQKEKEQADKDLEAKMGTPFSFELNQQKQLSNLKLYRQKLNQINKNIIDFSIDLNNINKRRQQKQIQMAKIRTQALSIDSCIDKKKFYLQMHQNKPHYREQDKTLSRKASQALIQKIKALI